MANGLELSSGCLVMTVAQEYMRNSALEKESGNRLLEFLETLPHWPENAGNGGESSGRGAGRLPGANCLRCPRDRGLPFGLIPNHVALISRRNTGYERIT
jgi:hypothetical protein